MKKLRVNDCLSPAFTSVVATDYPEKHAKASIFAVHEPKHNPTCLGLVSQQDIAMNPGLNFSDLVKCRTQPMLNNTHTVQQALALMKKINVDTLPVIDSQHTLLGIVTRGELLERLYQHEHKQLLIMRKKLTSMLQVKRELRNTLLNMQGTINASIGSDPLTGLPNLSQIREKIQLLIKQARLSNSQGAVLLIDIDNFKNVNDILGSFYGDLLLQQIPHRIVKTLKVNNLLARMGADEFIIVLPEIDSSDEAIFVAKAIMRALTKPFSVQAQEVLITASIGISVYPAGSRSVEAVFTNAGLALELAKDVGKNNYQIFIQSMGDKLKNSQKIEKYLHHALDNHELSIRYQPQVDIKNNQIIGMEALIRWQNTVIGPVAPDIFIPIAEKMEVILPMGEWVLETACNQITQWQKTGNPVRIAVNLSSRQFQEFNKSGGSHFIKCIQRVLEKTGLNPSLIELEITESIFMKNFQSSLTSLKQLKNLGLRISCDDFGTGYSSLNYIKHFPIDTIKIDKSFVSDIAYDPVNVAIIRAIILMAEQLNIEVIAEGVETETQLTMLRDLGCHIIQGYYYSKPLPPDEAALLL